MTRCVLVVDPLNDFCKGGALAVPRADEIMPIINAIFPKFTKAIAIQEWHPEDHFSFVTQGGRWKIHCVAGTWGAEFHPELNTKFFTAIIRKGINKLKEGYSAFEDTGLEGLLRSLGITEVFICGLATDYCVSQTALDSDMFFEKTFIIKDACRALSPETEKKALQAMTKAGIEIITSDQIK